MSGLEQFLIDLSSGEMYAVINDLAQSRYTNLIITSSEKLFNLYSQAHGKRKETPKGLLTKEEVQEVVKKHGYNNVFLKEKTAVLSGLQYQISQKTPSHNKRKAFSIDIQRIEMEICVSLWGLKEEKEIKKEIKNSICQIINDKLQQDPKYRLVAMTEGWETIMI